MYIYIYIYIYSKQDEAGVAHPPRRLREADGRGGFQGAREASGCEAYMYTYMYNDINV